MPKKKTSLPEWPPGACVKKGHAVCIHWQQILSFFIFTSALIAGMMMEEEEEEEEERRGVREGFTGFGFKILFIDFINMDTQYRI